jgi:3-phenylpropionate/cinnamic acid dioxygenase small subunit
MNLWNNKFHTYLEQTREAYKYVMDEKERKTDREKKKTK